MAICLIRTAIIYVSIIVSMRIMGKRQIGELGPSELVVAVLISDLAANPLQDTGTPLIYGLMPILLLLCFEILLSALLAKSVKFRALLCGKPCTIISDGIIDQRQMVVNRYTPDDLRESLRHSGITDITQVKSAILETDGTLSVILNASDSPLTPKDAGITVEEHRDPIAIICDGRMIETNLEPSGHDRKWLDAELNRLGVHSPDEVYLLTADESGVAYFARKDKHGK